MIAITLVAATGIAAAQAVYRSVGPDGKVIYSDKPPEGSRQVQKLDPVPPPPPVADPARQQARRAEEQRQVEDILKRGREQSAAFDKARADLAAAQAELAAARQRLADGAEPQPGERVGTAGGASRLGEAYFERQAALERAVKDAETRVSQAQRQVNDLR
jgi:hypothetical protein